VLTQRSTATKQIPSDFIFQLQASICRDSLYEFVKRAFPIVETDPFVDGWHIRDICMYLEKVYRGEITRQIINIPIGHMKSLLVNVLFPAWVWTKDPDKKFVCLSYSEDLVMRDSGKCKKLVESQWYQERFGVRLSGFPDTSTKFGTANGGWRYSFGFLGSYTGYHADYVLIDDPLKAAEALSEASKHEVIRVFDDAVYNRLKQSGKMIIIMQRLAEDDLCGHIEEKKLPFEWLVLPAEYEGIQRFVSTFGYKDPRTEVGEPLWTGRYGKVKLDDLKSAMTEYGVASQLQQRASPLEGNIFLRKWFTNRYAGEPIVAIYISCDTALTDKETSARSAVMVLGMTNRNKLVPLFIWKDKVIFPDLVDMILEISKRYAPQLYALIVEAKASGYSVMQTIERLAPEWLRDENGQTKIVSFTPPANLKKHERARLASKWCENGMVLLPLNTDENKDWLPDFEHELFNAPNGRYFDQVDCLVQAIFVLEDTLSDGFLYG
jgi:phage terminase large subunit-like protein